jgi:hypothetical protein
MSWPPGGSSGAIFAVAQLSRMGFCQIDTEGSARRAVAEPLGKY